MAKKKLVSAVDALRQLLASGNYHTKVQMAQHLAKERKHGEESSSHTN
jgi:hypothetical protein